MKSIIIPIYNQHDITRECLDSVIKHTTDYELVLIDNGSEVPFGFINLPEINAAMSEFGIMDGEVIPASMLNSDDEIIPVKAIRNNENLGFPAAVNQGITSATGDVIILLNNDVIVTPGWAYALEEALKHYDITGPVTNFCAGCQRDTIGAYENTQELDQRAREWMACNRDVIKPVNFVIGFCMAFKRALVDEIGLFDDSLWPCSGEEIDFCLKAVAAGKTCGIVRACYVHHEGSQTFHAMQEAGEVDYQKIVNRNDEHLARKWGNDFWLRQEV